MLPYDTNIILRAFNAYWAVGLHEKSCQINHEEWRNTDGKYLGEFGPSRRNTPHCKVGPIVYLIRPRVRYCI